MPYRMTYSKYGEMRFIGHIDLMQTIFRCLRRSGIDWEHTAGFNPRIKASFCPPLPLGLSGLQEFMDLWPVRPGNVDRMVSLIQREMPSGLKVVRIVFYPQPPRPKAAKYRVIGEAIEGGELDFQIDLAPERYVNPIQHAVQITGLDKRQLLSFDFRRERFIF
jgi:radical SAM-linked protein